jgi:glycosyltransferase involved in cell wall biosynthesis
MTAERLRTVLYVGQFAFVKAPHAVAAAMNRLALEHSELHFVWVCDARHHDAVRALLSPDVRERVELLPWLPQSELREVYDRAGVFLFPSIFEGFGKVFIEAMARGAIVIATRNSGARDLIEDGEEGFLIEPGDVDGIVRTAGSLFGQPERCEAISRAAAEKARMYTWTRAARECVAFYQRLRTLGPPRPDR